MASFPTSRNAGEKGGSHFQADGDGAAGADHGAEDGHHQHGQPEHQHAKEHAGHDPNHAGDDRHDPAADRHHETGDFSANHASQNPAMTPRLTNIITLPESMAPVAPPAPKRLPRYKRAPREVDFALTRRDLEILKIVQDFRLASSAHIQALADGSNQGILRRLQKLYHAGLLDRLSPRTRYGEGSAKMVYAITNQGVRTLQNKGLIPEPTATDWNFQNRTLHDLSIHHTLLIAHVRAVLAAACKKHPHMRLLFWREGPATQDAIEVALPEGYRRIPVAPDAYFALEDAKGRSYYFLEADPGTMTLKRFHLKLKAYAAYWREKKHHDKFGVRHFRVLTVTSSAERQANLVSAVQNDADLMGLARMLLFTDEAQLSLIELESIFGKIWRTAGKLAPTSLLG